MWPLEIIKFVFAVGSLLLFVWLTNRKIYQILKFNKINGNKIINGYMTMWMSECDIQSYA